MAELLDKDIIRKIKNGEIDYYSYIVKKYTTLIYRYIKIKLFKKDETDDLVQNVFISFYKAIEKFDEERPIKPYLFQIVQNELKMYFRSRKETVSLDESIKTTDDEKISLPSDDIEGLLKILPIEQKQALKLLSEGYSYEEIANSLKKPLNTVRTIIRRARLKMIKNYDKT